MLALTAMLATALSISNALNFLQDQFKPQTRNGQLLSVGSLFRRPVSTAQGYRGTVQIVGDVYLDVVAKVDDLPAWDGDTSITSPIETLPGGSALNTAVQLNNLLRTRKQGRQARPVRHCTLHSRVGTDLYGDLVADYIRDAGVDLSATRAGGQGVCICLSGDADRAFVSYKGSVGQLSESDIDIAALLQRGTRHVHFASYYDCVQLQPAVPRLIAQAKKVCNATVSIVPQYDSSGEWVSSGLIELLPQIDVLLCNQREAAAIAGVSYEGRRPSWAELDRAVSALLQMGVPLVVITLGADGAIAASNAQWWFQPTIREESPVDTTGCGDAFVAGFLFGWCGGRDVRRGLVYGCACGSAAVGQMGGSTPLTSDTINNFLPDVIEDGKWSDGQKSGLSFEMERRGQGMPVQTEAVEEMVEA